MLYKNKNRTSMSDIRFFLFCLFFIFNPNLKIRQGLAVRAASRTMSEYFCDFFWGHDCHFKIPPCYLAALPLDL